jgi:hypothetical protein
VTACYRELQSEHMLADLVGRLQKISGDKLHEVEVDKLTPEEETDWQELGMGTSSCAAALMRTLAWLIFLCATVVVTYAYFNFVFHKRN